MYSMNEYNLEPTYLLLTGINSDMFDETKMPQMLCFECVKKLQNFIEFSTKSLTAWSLLNDLIEQDKLSMDEIKRIDREKHMLSSKLGYTIFEPNYFDLEIQECVEENKALTNKYHSESLANFKDHKQSTFIDDETYLEMSVDGDGDTFTNIKEEIEEHDNLDIVPNENSLPIKNKNPDKSENPSENVYPSDKDEPSDGEDDFFYSNENVSENNSPIKNEEYDSEDDIYNSNEKQKFSKIYKREFVEMFEVKSLTIEMQKAVVESKKNTKRYKNSLFKCDKCFKAYNFELPFKKHMKRHTNECGEFVCPACHCHYLTRYNLTNHVRKQHEKHFQCRLCPFKTTTRCTARLHKKFHDGKRYRCKKCPKTFMKPSPYMAHKQRYHPEDAVCHLCGDSHAGFQNLASHIRSAHSGEDLKLPDDSPCCDQCEIRFRDKEAIRRHFAVSPLHGNPPKTPWKYKIIGKNKRPGYTKKVIICEQCGVECGDRRKYARHFASEHPGLNRTQYSGKFMCELCGNVLVTKALLNEHIKMHADDSKRNVFVCDICGVKRSTKSSMYLHKKDHRLSRKCEICMRVFASQANLNKHSRIHTTKPYACKICNKRFCMPSDRKAHIKHTHMGEPWPKKKKRPKGTAAQQTRHEEDMIEMDQCTEQSDVTQDNEEE
ncbi:hypothetical protein ABMA28_012682 [Loxostege sticticalis]|uniref:C2H2-type domain-containing protein n=1 Tax=Loxostege sticticalis TaxID=481309 RepID=A0ABD0S4P0_LOXSC